MGSLCFIWEDGNAPLTIKEKFYDATPLNLLLKEGENWIVNAVDIS